MAASAVQRLPRPIELKNGYFKRTTNKIPLQSVQQNSSLKQISISLSKMAIIRHKKIIFHHIQQPIFTSLTIPTKLIINPSKFTCQKTFESNGFILISFLCKKCTYDMESAHFGCFKSIRRLVQSYGY